MPIWRVGGAGGGVDREVGVLRDAAVGGDSDDVWRVGDRDGLGGVVLLVGEGVGELVHVGRLALVDGERRVQSEGDEVAAAEGQVDRGAGGIGGLHQVAVRVPVLAAADEVSGRRGREDEVDEIRVEERGVGQLADGDSGERARRGCVASQWVGCSSSPNSLRMAVLANCV